MPRRPSATAAQMLRAGGHWESPPHVPYIGEALAVGTARRYGTAEIHLLRDGMCEVLAAPRGS